MFVSTCNSKIDILGLKSMIFFIEEINNAIIMKLYYDYNYYCIYGCVQDNLKFVNICISFTWLCCCNVNFKLWMVTFYATADILPLVGIEYSGCQGRGL